MLKSLFTSILIVLSSTIFASSQNLNGKQAQETPVQPCEIGDFGCRHTDYHQWYQTGENGGPIMRPDMPSSSCCNDDCRPTKVKWINDDVYAYIDREWILVPSTKIKKIKKLDSLAHVCARKTGFWGQKVQTVYCLILPDLEN